MESCDHLYPERKHEYEGVYIKTYLLMSKFYKFCFWVISEEQTSLYMFEFHLKYKNK